MLKAIIFSVFKFISVVLISTVAIYIALLPAYLLSRFLYVDIISASILCVIFWVVFVFAYVKGKEKFDDIMYRQRESRRSNL